MFSPIILLLMAFAPSSAETELLEQWVPMVSQPIEQLENLLDTLEQQQPMNYTASNICFLYDARLYILFNQCLTRLSGSEREGLALEQTHWLSLRTDSVSAIYDEFQGGTLAPLAAAGIYLDMTRERIEELEKAY